MELLDMLDEAPAWMSSLVAHFQPGPVGLFRSCTKLQQLVFTQFGLRPHLSFNLEDISMLGSSKHWRALALAEASHSNVHLHIQAIAGDPNSIRISTVTAFTKAALLQELRTGQFQKPPAPYKLQCITSISLQKVHLDCLVPDFLALGCPNLNELELCDVTVVASDVAFRPTCTSLRKLSLRTVTTHAYQLQSLPALPSLTDLCMTSSEDEEDFAEDRLCSAALRKYSQHLKRLVCCLPREAVPWAPGVVFPQLKHLSLDKAQITDDEDLQELLDAAPNVTHVSLHSISCLETSFAQSPCSWQHLSLWYVHANCLAKLPLSSCTRLVCKEQIYLRRGGDPTTEQISAGVAATQAVGGLHFSNTIIIRLDQDDEQSVTAAGPLLQNLEDFVMLGIELSRSPDAVHNVRSLLAVLGQYLRCSTVMLWQDDSWLHSSRALPQMPQLLPHVKGFICDGAPDEDLVEMCRTATRPFRLLSAHLPPALREQLQAAMREAGHQLVTLDTSLVACGVCLVMCCATEET